ncbi:MAG TPA: condensation domain-containing protein, partial [Pyrinomonadaceae bacterium]|nr:condensation domain-containing protein [Pyrinomonadaceae bacterium]
MVEKDKPARERERGDEPRTLVELLRHRADRTPDKRAYTFLAAGEDEEESLTYGELERRVRAVAAALRASGAEGERALLLYPPGLDFIVGFFGCLYAGAVAVPVYPPDPAQPARTLKRLQAVIADARAEVAMTTSPILRRFGGVLEQSPHLKSLRWLASDAAAGEADAAAWRMPELTRESLAFLQYTSGSTGAPKGVMLTHGNLLHNASVVYRAFSHTPDDKYISWLPTFHDMGLMAGVLQPLYGDLPAVLMSPLAFLQKPLRWLQAITRHRGTTSGGPNFAYDLCLRKITPAERASLDLSSWAVAFNGAEPVRHETLERFAEVFAPCGFRREALYPCYGLAEATLIVSGGRRSGGYVVRKVDARALEDHRVVEAPEAEGVEVRALVSSGRALCEQEVAIVRPDTLARCADGEVGEVWVSGPSVGQGYWNRPEESEPVFRARVAGTGEGPFLRTGDLGFVRDGELCVTGRHKDLIIIRGHNHYPQDIEWAAEQSHPALRKGCGAAFAVEAEGEERLVVVQEVDPARLPADPEEVFDAIRRAVAEAHELQVYGVALLKPGSVPKTSSGKIQRRACRDGFLRGELEEVGRSLLSEDAGGAGGAEGEESFIRRALLAVEAGRRKPLLESYLLEQVSRALRVPASRLRPTRPLTAFGLDSLTAVELKNAVEADLEVGVPLTAFLHGESIGQLADALLEELAAPAPAARGAARREGREDESSPYPLSHVQESIWFLNQLSPEAAAYNVAFASVVRSEVEAVPLRRALQALVARHPALRAEFGERGGEPLQRARAEAEVDFEHAADTSADLDALRARAEEAAHAPFDVERGRVFRARLFTRAPREHVLLLAAHHLVIDGWSLWVLLDELRELYAAELDRRPAALAPPRATYRDYVRAQRELLAGAEGERLWEFWRGELRGDLPALDLPTCRPAPRAPSFRGASHPFVLEEALTARLRALAESEATTLYTLLVAAFQTVLHRYSGQDDFLIGSPVSGRGRAEFEGVVGCFFNALVLRAAFPSDFTFREFLRRTRATVRGALEHQDYPAHLLAQRLQPNRPPGRGQLFQVTLIMQQPHRAAAA